MNSDAIIIRDADPAEYTSAGELMVKIYAGLEGFPAPDEQPDYYKLLYNVGELTKNPSIRLIVAVDEANRLLGTVVYFGDMAYYGSGGTATSEVNAAGFRLLAVDSEVRGRGIGKKLILECIQLARAAQLQQLIIHSTEAMRAAWTIYDKLGFKRAPGLDFMQEDLPVFGFRLQLQGTT